MTVARGHMLQAEAQAHERVVKEEKTKVYQIVASLAASNICFTTFWENRGSY